MTDMDFAVEDSEIARRVLAELGHSQSVSLEPGDYKRDKVAEIISQVRRKAKADGMREAADIVDAKAHPDSRITAIECSKDERYHYTRIKTAGLSDLIREAASQLSPTTNKKGNDAG